MLQCKPVSQPQARSLRLFVAGSRSLLRAPLLQALMGEPQVDLSMHDGDATTLIDLARRYEPQILAVSDDWLRRQGIAAMRRVASETGSLVILLASPNCSDLAKPALLAGARGCLDPFAQSVAPVEVLRCLAAGLNVLAPFAFAALQREGGANVPAGPVPQADPLLTQRESQVVSGVLAGRTNKEIANDMGLSEGTVKNHVSRVLSKLHVRSRTQLVARRFQRTLA